MKWAEDNGERGETMKTFLEEDEEMIDSLEEAEERWVQEEVVEEEMTSAKEEDMTLVEGEAKKVLVEDVDMAMTMTRKRTSMAVEGEDLIMDEAEEDMMTCMDMAEGDVVEDMRTCLGEEEVEEGAMVLLSMMTMGMEENLTQIACSMGRTIMRI